MFNNHVLNEKIKEASASALPITLIVALLCLFFVPMDTGLMLSFLAGSVMLIAGMGLFTLGSDMAMSRIGNYIGSKMTRSRKLWLIIALSFILGTSITMAEPDLQVLAANVPAIDKTVLIMTVSIGVGIFLVICMLRILFAVSLRNLLIIFYAAIFVAAYFSDADMLFFAHFFCCRSARQRYRLNGV